MRIDDAQRLQLPDAIGRILGRPGSDRDRALLEVCDDVLESLGEHYVKPLPEPRLPEAFRGISREQLSNQVHASGAIALAFGQWRNAVLSHEEQCARKLEVLRSTARTLLRLRDQAPEPEAFDAKLDRLFNHVAAVWRCDLDTGSNRDWSLRLARRYDLLPAALREL